MAELGGRPPRAAWSRAASLASQTRTDRFQCSPRAAYTESDWRCGTERVWHAQTTFSFPACAKNVVWGTRLRAVLVQ